jgi:hypothetical protein
METIFNLILGFLSLISVIATYWCITVPVGIVVAILKKFNKVKLSWNKIWLYFFGGIGLLVIDFLLFFIVNLIARLIGVHVHFITLSK